MRKARFWGLLWTSFILELQGAPTSESKRTLTEGTHLLEKCPVSVNKYLHYRKAWQRLGDGGEIQTLVNTELTSGMNSRVQMGRYLLDDMPCEGIMYVHMSDLRLEDSGLYRCVIYQPPKAPIPLHQPIRLVVIKDPASHIDSIKNLVRSSTLPPVNTTTRARTRTSTRPVTQPMSTASLGVNPTHKTDTPRISTTSIITIVVCGILSKSLVFTLLLIATQRSFGS
ncbi:unnamed protein product [Pipistrellus nathusii]|uniref:Immunoglobulin V-set domain-containing protein n=1 Tax=Pipistrellus nathusii TaxID=59473 RepID=A0ABP0A910_PIPNA